MKKHVLLLFATLLFFQAAFAYDFSAVAPSGQTLYYSIGSTSATVVSPAVGWSNYTKPIGNLVIPDSVTYNGITYPVTSIGALAFKDCSGLTSISIPNSVTSIRNRAFVGCSGLTSITIPNSVTSIGDDAFFDCNGLTSIVVASGNTHYDSRNNCNAIIETSSNILIKGCQTTIIPNSVTNIGISAFSNCSGLTSISIPNSVTDIGIRAFSNCSGLTSISIPNSVTYIWEGTFEYCSGLTSIIIPNSVTSIGDGAFIGCSGLTSVTIPNSVTSIGAYAFQDCSGLTSVTIPNSVTSIRNRAFVGCSGLTSVTIPNSVTIIGEEAFSSCSGLTSIIVASGNTRYDSRNNCNAIIETSYNSLILGCQTTIIPNSVTDIGIRAFSNCSGLTSISIPNSVTYIGWGAFSGCSGLTSVTIPNSVTRIGNSAFVGCSGLTSVTFGNSVTSLGRGLFLNCNNIASLSFLGLMPPDCTHSIPSIQDLPYPTFSGIPTDIPVYIPCGRMAYYVYQMPYFTNYIEHLYEFSAASADESRGTVQVLTEPSCTNPNAVLNAVPANGYRFDHWSTGSTDNPYTLTVTNDTTIIGYFVANGTQGIGKVGEDEIHISVSNGHINVEGVAEEEVRVYDITGRMVQNRSLPSGVYIVKIGTLLAQKVVVMR